MTGYGNPYQEGKLLYRVDPLRDIYYFAYDLRTPSEEEFRALFGRERQDGEQQYIYEWLFLDHKPTREEMAALIYEHINARCDAAILEGGVYTTLEDEPRRCRLYLSQQNQFNWKAIYDMACRLEGRNLPAVFKMGVSDEDAYYYTITSMRQLEHFILSVFKFIETTLAACWQAKQSVDFTPYTLDSNGTEENEAVS